MPTTRTPTKLSQRARILRHLERGDRLTAAAAEARYGCTRLAARINDLRRQGHPIQSRMVRVPTRGGWTKVAEYYLV